MIYRPFVVSRIMNHCIKRSKLYLLVRWRHTTILQSEWEKGLRDKNHWISHFENDIQKKVNLSDSTVTIVWKETLVPIENFSKGQSLLKYLKQHKLEKHWTCLTERSK